MASQKDVAKLAGVSHGTVSNVIRGDRYVAPETEQKVREAIKELNYEVNSIASSLKSKKTDTVGFIVSDIFGSFYAGVTKTIQERFRKHGSSMIICYSGDDPEQESRYLRVLKSRQVDGIILTPASDDNRDQINRLVESGTSVVIVDNYIEGIRGDFVGVDNFGGAFNAVEHLIQNGFRDIAIVDANTGYTGRERYRGYRNALEKHGLSKRGSREALADYRKKDVYALADHLFTGDDRPDAVFTTALFTTLATYKDLHDRSLLVPDDVAMVGFDDVSTGSHLTEPLELASLPITCVRQPIHEIGTEAAELLISRIEADDSGTPFEPKKIELGTELVIRNSSAPKR